SEPRSVFTEFSAAAARFDADHLDARVAQKSVEQADGVRTPADARVEMRGKTPLGGENLLASFAADHRLKIADHRRIGMRAKNGTQKIVRGANVGNPDAHGFVDGVLKRAAAGIDADNLRPQKAHARNVECLPRHVLRTHVHDAFKTE